MAETERKVAGFTVGDGTDTFANVTNFEKNMSISEEEVSGLADTTSGSPPILKEKYLPVSVGETASLSGVAFGGDGSGTGPHSAALEGFETKARQGTIFTLEYRYEDGSGWDIEGFFTEFNYTGDKGEATEKYSGNFRINDVTKVTL